MASEMAELAGMSTAAHRGFMWPATAMPTTVRLYASAKPNAARTTRERRRARWRS
jgi:hypothetical protein